MADRNYDPDVDDTSNIPDRQRLARIGEHLAAQYIESKMGWQIKARNWHHERGEIDIIAEDESGLVFVEVRTRRGYDSLPYALASVNERKQEQLRLLVAAYRAEHELPEDMAVRVDVIGVALENNGRYKIELVRDALGW